MFRYYCNIDLRMPSHSKAKAKKVWQSNDPSGHRRAVDKFYTTRYDEF